MARMNRPAPVEITYKNMRFLITHNPTNVTLNKFIEELKKYGVSTVVRVCEATYDSTLVVKEGIQVLLCQKPLCQVSFLGCRPELSNMADHLAAHAQYRPGRGTDRVVTCTAHTSIAFWLRSHTKARAA